MNIEYPHIPISLCITEHHWQLSGGNLQKALLLALEATEKTRWRVVCANIITECDEPYRTLVLSRKVLEELRAQQLQYRKNLADGANHSHYEYKELFRFTADMHMPLAQDRHTSADFEAAAQLSPV